MSCHSTHVGIAATGYAKAVTDFDDGQVSSIFHRLKKDHADAPAPSAEEAVTTLVRMRREVLDDTRLPQATALRIADRYAHAIEAVNRGVVPDGRTWAAMQKTMVEAEAAQANLGHLLRESARQQRTDPDRLAAKFRQWRLREDYEDVASPDEAFRPDQRDYPADKNTARALRKLGWENHLAQRLPVFVYGTLRQGEANSHLMGNAVEGEPVNATVAGVGIYGADQGFPYAVEHPSASTVGDLVHLEDSWKGDRAREALDRLEGFSANRPSGSHYRRVVAQVTHRDPATGEQVQTKAWTYLAGAYAAAGLRESDRITDGDWVRAKNAYRGAGRSRYGRYGGTGYADSYADEVGEEPSFTGEIRVTKRAVDVAPSRSARDSAAVFESMGVLDEDPADDAGFWSSVNR